MSKAEKTRGFVLLQVIVTLLMLALIASLLLRLGLGGRILMDRQRQSEQGAALAQGAFNQTAACLATQPPPVSGTSCTLAPACALSSYQGVSMSADLVGAAPDCSIKIFCPACGAAGGVTNN